MVAKWWVVKPRSTARWAISSNFLFMKGSPSSVQWITVVPAPPLRIFSNSVAARSGESADGGITSKWVGLDCGQKAHLKLQRLVSSMLISVGRYGSTRLFRTFQW